jgi:hypothetical protein
MDPYSNSGSNSLDTQNSDSLSSFDDLVNGQVDDDYGQDDDSSNDEEED